MFQSGQRGKWLTEPLLDEQLVLLASETLLDADTTHSMTLEAVARLPLVLPSGNHGLRAVLNAAFERAQVWPNLVAEVDGLAMLMDVVQSGLSATIQPGSAMARISHPGLRAYTLSDKELRRPSFLATLPEEELSPAALAMRNIIREVAATLVESAQWPGASLYKS